MLKEMKSRLSDDKTGFTGKKLLVVFFAFVFSTLLIGQSLNKVTIGSSANSIKIKVTNPIQEQMDNVTVNVTSKPEWIEFEESISNITAIEKNSSEYSTFSFKVKNDVVPETPGEIHFTIKDNKGRTWTKKINLETVVPDKFELEQNYPNPFNPTTKISFSLPLETKVKLVVYNLLGEEITVLVNEQLKAGKHEREFNASNLSSGVYFYRLESGSFTAVKKLMLLK